MADQLLTAAMEGRMTWKPISSAPRDGTWIILGRVGHAEILFGYWHRLFNQWWGQGGTDKTWKKWQEASNWMPLPEPPKASDDAP